MKLPIAEERWLTSYCTLELHDGKAVKTFNKNFPKHLDNNWFNHYNMFRTINDTPVKIYEIKNNQIIMECIPGAMTVTQWIHKEGTSQSRLSHVASCIFKLCSDMLDYSQDMESLFYHEDLNLTNFMIWENKITLVDPESFVFGKTINYDAMIQPHINLGKVAHKILEKTIDNTKFY